MAEQTAIDYYSLEWKDDAAGGTPIEAAALNRMEQGIADACAGVDQLRTKRLPTYLVAQDGDTATQDVYQEAILGPCLILDLATRTTYYESGGDEDGHRKAITSGSDIDALGYSLSQGLVFRGRVNDVHNLKQNGIYASDSAANAPTTGYVTYICILQNNDSKYPIIFGLALNGAIYNCWKTTSGSFSSWRRIDV